MFGSLAKATSWKETSSKSYEYPARLLCTVRRCVTVPLKDFLPSYNRPTAAIRTDCSSLKHMVVRQPRANDPDAFSRYSKTAPSIDTKFFISAYVRLARSQKMPQIILISQAVARLQYGWSITSPCVVSRVRAHAASSTGKQLNNA